MKENGMMEECTQTGNPQKEEEHANKLQNKYFDVFAESRGTLLGNGTTNASPLQRNNRGIPRSGIFY
jgi:hypothetical protein